MKWLIGFIIVAIAVICGILFIGIVALQIAIDEWRKRNGE